MRSSLANASGRPITAVRRAARSSRLSATVPGKAAPIARNARPLGACN